METNYCSMKRRLFPSFLKKDVKKGAPLIESPIFNITNKRLQYFVGSDDDSLADRNISFNKNSL